MKNFAHYIINSSIPLNRLATKSGISESRLRAIGEDIVQPDYDELRIISKVLNLPISYLISEYSLNQDLAVLFRKSFGSEDDSLIVDKFNYIIDGVLSLEPDNSKVENIHNKIQPADNTYVNADRLSCAFRDIYFNGNQFDPLNTLPNLLANELGFIVKVVELGNNADGASALINNFVFLFVSPRFEGRMLFTLAHELAHIVNHHGQGNFFYFDERITFRPKGDTNNVERFANAFASCLLLPQDGVVRMVQKVREIQRIPENSALGDIEISYLARFYGVSFDVAANRCEALNLLPEGGAHSLSLKLRKDHGSAEKRADELGLPPRPTIIFPPVPNFILDRALVLIEKGQYSVGKIADILSIPVKSIIDYHSNIA